MGAIRIKLVKNHVSIGTVIHAAGDIVEVSPSLANRLISEKAAVIALEIPQAAQAAKGEAETADLRKRIAKLEKATVNPVK